MSNYPNMSYCMVQNTELALRQVADEIGHIGMKEFMASLSKDEKYAWSRLALLISEMAEEIENPDEEFEVSPWD